MATALASPQLAGPKLAEQALAGMIRRVHSATTAQSARREPGAGSLLQQFGTALQEAQPQLLQELHRGTEDAEALAGRLQLLSSKLQDSVLNPLLGTGPSDMVQACAQLRAMCSDFEKLQAAEDEEARGQLWEQLLSGDNGPAGASETVPTPASAATPAPAPAPQPEAVPAPADVREPEPEPLPDPEPLPKPEPLPEPEPEPEERAVDRSRRDQEVVTLCEEFPTLDEDDLISRAYNDAGCDLEATRALLSSELSERDAVHAARLQASEPEPAPAPAPAPPGPSTVDFAGPTDAGDDQDVVRINILVCGASGLGKSTFIETLVELLYNPENSQEDFKVDVDIGEVAQDASFPPLAPTVETREVANFVVKQRGNVDVDNFRLSFIDAVGYGGQVNNTAVLDGIEHVLQERMQRTDRVGPEELHRDYRIHAVLYFIAPHRFQQIDAQYIYRLARYAPIIPVLAKADTLDIDPKRGRAFQRKHILRELLEIDDLLRGYQYEDQEAMEDCGHTLSDTLFDRDMVEPTGASPANNENQDDGAGAAESKDDTASTDKKKKRDRTVSTDGERSREQKDVQKNHRNQPMEAQREKEPGIWQQTVRLVSMLFQEQKVLVPEGAIFPARALRREGAEGVRRWYRAGLGTPVRGNQIKRPGPRDIFLIIADKTLRRDYMWSKDGAQVTNAQHCDFVRLAKLLVNGDLRPLRFVTAEKHKRHRLRVRLLFVMLPFNTLAKQLMWCLLLFILQLNGAAHRFVMDHNMEHIVQWLDVIFVCLYLMCIVSMAFRSFRLVQEWNDNRKLSRRIEGQRGTDEFHDGTLRCAVEVSPGQTASKEVAMPTDATRLRLVFRVRPLRSWYGAIRDWLSPRSCPVPRVELFSTDPTVPGAATCRFTQRSLLRGEIEAIVQQGSCFVQATCPDEGNCPRVSVEIAATSVDRRHRPKERNTVGSIPTVSRSYLSSRVLEERQLVSRRFWSLLLCLLLAFLWVKPFSQMVESPRAQVESTETHNDKSFSITPTQNWLFGSVRNGTDAVVRWAYQMQTGDMTDTGVCAAVKNALLDKMQKQRREMNATCEEEKTASCKLCQGEERSFSDQKLVEKIGKLNECKEGRRKAETERNNLGNKLKSCQDESARKGKLEEELASCQQQCEEGERQLKECKSDTQTCGASDDTQKKKLKRCEDKKTQLTKDKNKLEEDLESMRELCVYNKHNWRRKECKIPAISHLP